ncbi:glycoside hydrolase family 31 protein [Chaetomium sp. MPI-CAGE-AT-0009]|nr:glycoside hydrolase family 31 protein [Chaetomium sp. MPI-CAGE-AT-0009]
MIMVVAMESASPPTRPPIRAPRLSASARMGERSYREPSRFRRRDAGTCESTVTATLAPGQTCPAGPSSGGRCPSSDTPLSTPSLASSLLVLAAGLETALAGTTSGYGKTGQQEPSLQGGAGSCSKLSAEWYLLGWTWDTLTIHQPGFQAYILVGIVLSAFFLGLTYSFRNRLRITPTGRLKNPDLVLSVMALFTLTTFFLLAGLHLHATLGDHGPPSDSWRPGMPNQVAGHAPVFTIPAWADVGKDVLPNIRDPKATDAQTVCPGYKASNVQDTESGFTADLDLAGSACNVYGNDVEHLALSVEFQGDDRVHVEIRPRYISAENETWFLLPEELVPRPSAGNRDSQHSNGLAVSWSNDPTFSFAVKRVETGDVLFSTEGKVLVYEDQFIEFVSSLPENYNLYGLGEVLHGFRLGNNFTRTLFAADVGDVIDANLYGSHPIYLDTRYFTVDDSGKLTYAPDATDKTEKYLSYTHGVFLRNAHTQEVLLQPSGITWRALGGSIDLYFYSGPGAAEVMSSYQQSTTGLPAMQQYWTLGFHQCRWGYDSWAAMQEVVDNFAKFEIPLETIWSDIDYMRQYRDFENDPVRFSYDEGAEFLAKLHANDQHYIPIVDSAIYAPNPENPSDAYPPYDRGIEAKAFVMNPDGSIYYGAVWPGYTVFPDWVGAVLNGSGAIDWWIDELSRWSEKIAFDGLWIDMSEVASFCVGSCGSGNLTLNPAHPPFDLPGEPGNLILQYPEGFERTNSSEAIPAASALRAQEAASPTTASPTSYYRTRPTPGARNVNWPPYVVNNFHGDLAVHAISPNATHHGGYVQYDFHNLFGHQILNATYQALLKISKDKRPFIIGRSTFAGSGKWAGHWGGDNEALWAHMYFSIPQALSFSLFGVPMFGVDTCGFGGNSARELCARWMQLSAFFPFYRNHNTLGAIPQEPYLWADVAAASRAAMRVRYALLPYLYTLLARASQRGDAVLRALAWEFPREPWLAAADRQFLLGPALLVSPCLEQGATTVGAVFPGVRDGGTLWYDWYTATPVTGVAPGQNVTLDAPLGHIPVHLRGGSVVPVQEPGLTTAESRRNPWGLVVALDRDGLAEGELYLDDGESLEPEAVTWVRFAATNTSVSADPQGDYVDTNALANATVMGLAKGPVRVWVNSRVLDFENWDYDQERAALSLHGLNHLFPHGAWAERWEINWE